MKNFDGRTYSVADIREWNSAGLLILSPMFQRRSVWSRQAKSYLIDTVLRGKPMPKVLINQELRDGRNVRTVIDGQQRLRAILEFLDGDFEVSRSHNIELGGKTYQELPSDVRDAVLQYEIGVDVLFDMSLEDLLDIFSRLNTYSVKLNSTELLNAKYVGDFKITAHELGHRYAAMLLEARVVTSTQLARMKDVEIAADLLATILNGVQRRTSVESAYRAFDEGRAAEVDEARRVFEETMTLLVSIYDPADLAATNFRREHQFYSLFVALAATYFGRPEIAVSANPTPHARLRTVLDDVSAQIDHWTEIQKEERDFVPDDWSAFLSASKLRTTDASARRVRTQFIAARLGL